MIGPLHVPQPRLLPCDPRGAQNDARTAVVKRVAALGIYALLAACSPEGEVSAELRPDILPDILIVVTDDQGWGDWEGSGNPDIRTPAMMRLAEQGASFTDFHVSPVCAPTRANLLSGRHALETGVWGVTRGGERMRPEVETLAEALRDAGYRTGLFGKWHNGDSAPYDPMSQGFERFFGFTEGHLTNYFDPEVTDDGKPVKTKGYITNVITDAALDWMGASDEPTLTVVTYNTPHSPFEVPDADLAPYLDTDLPPVTQVIYAMITQTDAQFGRLLDAVGDDAVVIFVGDNGPAVPGGVRRFDGGLSGQKGSVLFGGTQVPMLMRWPGVTTAGSEIATPGHGIDIMPTLLKGLGLEVNAEVDGVDLAPVLGGGALPERTLFTHHANVLLKPGTIPIEVDPGAARRGDFSAVVDPEGNWALYADRAQSVDVKDQHPDVFERMRADYLDWFEASAPFARDALPTVIADAPIQLPAHNGTPGEGAVFARQWGWAHDWVVAENGGTVRWPVSMRGGRYRLGVEYSGEGRFELLGETFALPPADAPLRFAEPGHRRVVFTAEALTRDWALEDFGEIALPTGDRDLELRLAGPVELKSITLTPVD